MPNNDHTRVSTRPQKVEQDVSKVLKASLSIERRMGRPVEGEKISLLFGAQMIVGREKSSDICIPDDRISRKHSLIRVDHDAVRLADLGSTNGTVRNDEPVNEEIIIETGDLITFGQAKTFEARIIQRDEIITSVRLASGPEGYLLVPQEIIIGFADPKSEDVDLKIYDPSLLPKHARIEFFTGMTFIVSLDENKPVIVNSNPVREIEIRNDYLIELGGVLLRFERAS